MCSPVSPLPSRPNSADPAVYRCPEEESRAEMLSPHEACSMRWDGGGVGGSILSARRQTSYDVIDGAGDSGADSGSSRTETAPAGGKTSGGKKNRIHGAGANARRKNSPERS